MSADLLKSKAGEQEKRASWCREGSQFRQLVPCNALIKLFPFYQHLPVETKPEVTKAYTNSETKFEKSKERQHTSARLIK